jgi:hypothetical protein
MIILILEIGILTIWVLRGILVPSVALPRSAALFLVPRHLMVKGNLKGQHNP